MTDIDRIFPHIRSSQMKSVRLLWHSSRGTWKVYSEVDGKKKNWNALIVIIKLLPLFRLHLRLWESAKIASESTVKRVNVWTVEVCMQLQKNSVSRFYQEH